MSRTSREVLFDFLKGRNTASLEDVKTAQRTYYETLVDGQALTLTELAPLSEHRSKLWGTLKRSGYEDQPHGIAIGLRLEDENVVIRLALQCRVEGERGTRPTTEDLVRHSRFLDVTLDDMEGVHHMLDSKRIRPDMISKEGIGRGEHRKLELVYRLSEADVKDDLSMEDMFSDRLRQVMGKFVTCYDAIIGEGLPGSGAMDRSMKKLSGRGKNVIHPKNMILQGPPGTGKTYHTVLYAVAIIEGKSFEEIKEEVAEEGYEVVKERYTGYRDENRIAFTTFHQSYGYEEFIEGIKPMVNDSGEVGFNIESGIFKEFCEMATTNHRISPSARIWKISLGGAGERDIKTRCFEDGTIRIGFTKHGETPLLDDEKMTSAMKNVFTYFYDTMEIGDVVLSLKDHEHIDGIGIIEGEAEWLKDEERYKRCRKVKWLAKDISESILEMNMRKKMTQKTIYPLNRLTVSQIERIITKHDAVEKDDEERSEPYVFIIDEINRGNISKILGELITLIEPSKRLGEVEETLVKLPYSKKEFGVPDNIHIIGTMNTADRSIALMDTALRRRFRFVEMSPDPSTLRGISVGGVDIERLLEVMNRRIEALYDRDHMIGHAYFTDLSSDDDVDALKEIFLKSIIPLLQEYFFDDYEKIRAVLGDGPRKEDAHILKGRPDASGLFNMSVHLSGIENGYTVDHEALSTPEVYRAIYAGHHAKV